MSSHCCCNNQKNWRTIQQKRGHKSSSNKITFGGMISSHCISKIQRQWRAQVLFIKDTEMTFVGSCPHKNKKSVLHEQSAAQKTIKSWWAHVLIINHEGHKSSSFQTNKLVSWEHVLIETKRREQFLIIKQIQCFLWDHVLTFCSKNQKNEGHNASS